jgi:hypothetical protein
MLAKNPHLFYYAVIDFYVIIISLKCSNGSDFFLSMKISKNAFKLFLQTYYIMKVKF